MMPLWAVAYMSMFDNELVLEIVMATSFKDAIFKHSSLKSDAGKPWVIALPDNPEDLKEHFFDCDIAIEAIEVQCPA